MTAELIIAPEAQQDVDEAYSWYEDRRPGLGEEFLSCVDACIQTISRMPELYAKVHEEYITISLKRHFACS
jgi:plasmid stabilization system protein ParE